LAESALPVMSRHHAVKLVLGSNEVDVAGGSVTINMTGCTPGQFVYTALASPLILASGTTYHLASQETDGGDQWYDYDPVINDPGVSMNGLVFSWGTSWITVGVSGVSYVPPNLK
jgi:hypothetical protein